MHELLTYVTSHKWPVKEGRGEVSWFLFESGALRPQKELNQPPERSDSKDTVYLNTEFEQ